VKTGQSGTQSTTIGEFGGSINEPKSNDRFEKARQGVQPTSVQKGRFVWADDADEYEIVGSSVIGAIADGKVSNDTGELVMKRRPRIRSLYQNSSAADEKADLKSSAATTDKSELALKPNLRGVSITPLMGKGKKARGMYFRTQLHYGGTVASNSSAGKYIQFIGGATTFAPNTVSSAGEWTSFNSVFEEFFIHSMKIQYQPNNQFLQGYVNGTSTNVQTSLAVISAYQHDQPTPSDAAQAYYQFMNASQTKVWNTGRPMSFTWRNIEKFDKNGPVGDATTATHTQTWMNMGDVAKYGGYIIFATVYPTSASPSAGAYGQSVTWGDFVASYDISFRYRD